MKIDYILEQFNLFENYKLARREFSEFASASEIEDLFKEFKRISGRISDPKQKDINYWRKQGYSSFKKFVDGLTNVQSRREYDREIKSASKDILTVKKTDTMHLFMPLSKEASCFYGYKGDGRGSGGWCISTKTGQNYFYNYTIRSGLYIFFLIYDNAVYALVMDAEGEIYECRDFNNDNSFSDDEFFRMSGTTINTLMRFIWENNDQIKLRLESSNETSLRRSLNNLIKRGDEKEILQFIKDNRDDILSSKIRWPETEKYIMKVKEVSIDYAMEILNKRWPEAEKYMFGPTKNYAVITSMQHYIHRYLNNIKDDLTKLEPYILKSDPEVIYSYIVYVRNAQPWPEAEKYLLKDKQYAYIYAMSVLNKRWPELETENFLNSGAGRAYANHFNIQ